MDQSEVCYSVIFVDIIDIRVEAFRELCTIFLSFCIFHWCLAANLKIGINDGEMVLNGLLNSTTVGRFLMIFSADPHEISIPIEC